MTFSFCVIGPEYWIEMHISAYCCLPIFHREHIIAVLKIYTFGLKNTSIKKSRLYVNTFFNLLFYFNWRLIILQYCGGFCHTFTWISHGCTCVPHHDPPLHLPPHDIDFIKNKRQLDNKVRNIGVVFFYIHVSTEHSTGSDQVHLEF